MMNKELKNIQLIQNIEEFIKKQEGPIKIGILFNGWIKEKQGQFISYKTFQRLIQELAEREIVFVKKIIGGAYGTTTLISNKEIK